MRISCLEQCRRSTHNLTRRRALRSLHPQPTHSLTLPLIFPKNILLHHPPTNRMIKVPVLLERLHSDVSIQIKQVAISIPNTRQSPPNTSLPSVGCVVYSQRPHKLHPPHPAQQLARRLHNTLVLRLQPHLKIPTRNLDIPRLREPVHLAHGLRV
jgi:hypothetical protein